LLALLLGLCDAECAIVGLPLALTASFRFYPDREQNLMPFALSGFCFESYEYDFDVDLGSAGALSSIRLRLRAQPFPDYPSRLRWRWQEARDLLGDLIRSAKFGRHPHAANFAAMRLYHAKRS
jgi:hypothetical protein